MFRELTWRARICFSPPPNLLQKVLDSFLSRFSILVMAPKPVVRGDGADIEERPHWEPFLSRGAWAILLITLSDDGTIRKSMQG